MKKLLLLLCAATITLALVSCNSGEEDKLTLSETNVSLKSDETLQLIITSGNSKDVFWSSNNNYVATVNSKGLITARKVGEAIISATDDVSCTVTVTPRHTFMTEPDTNWGASRSSIISKYGTPTNSNEDGIGYQDLNNTIVPSVAYIFEDDRLIRSGILVNVSHEEQLKSFLLERYTALSVEPQGEVLATFCNGLTENEATTAVGIFLYNTDYLFVVYSDMAPLPTQSTTNDLPLRCLLSPKAN